MTALMRSELLRGNCIVSRSFVALLRRLCWVPFVGGGNIVLAKNNTDNKNLGDTAMSTLAQ